MVNTEFFTIKYAGTLSNFKAGIYTEYRINSVYRDEYYKALANGDPRKFISFLCRRGVIAQ